MTDGSDGQAVTFAGLLRKLRLDAGLTQEALADQVRMSVRGIQDLERGVARPRRDTLRRLADALAPTGDALAVFEAARSPTPRHRAAPPISAISPAPTTVSSTLPVPLAPLIGRGAVVAALLSLLGTTTGDAPEARLVTLTGPGGIGKTRLALHVAGELAGDFPDGVIYVPLSEVRDPGLVGATIARLIGSAEEVGHSAEHRVSEFFRARRSLLALDNFEHVLEAASLVARLLGGCPGLSVLVTSRAPLHVQGEFEFATPPLDTPSLDFHGALEIGAATTYGAVALFAARARMVRRDFEVTAETAPLIAEICARLDGLPLAIELAAARIKFLSLPELLTRLDHRLGLLTGGARDLPERQQTMRNTIAWSYERLDLKAQELFRRLSVFVGGCSLTVIAALQGSPPGSVIALGENPMPAIDDDVLSDVASLVDNSLLSSTHRTNSGAGETRFSMLETIREYGLECLAASGDGNLMRQRHAEYFLALAERAEPELTGAGQAAWLDLLDQEHANIRAALDWLQDLDWTPDQVLRLMALRMAGALWRFWHLRGHLTEGSDHLQKALESAPSEAAPSLQAKAFLGACSMEILRGDRERAQYLAEQGLQRYQTCNDANGTASALNLLGIMAADRGEYAAAGDLFSKGLALSRQFGAPRDVAVALGNLGIVARRRKDYARAAALYAEAATLHQAAGNTQGVANSLTNQAAAAYHQGYIGQAKDLYRRGLRLHRQVGNKVGAVNSVVGLATVARAEGAMVLAATLLGATEALRREIGFSLAPEDNALVALEVADVKTILGEETFARAWAAGAAMTLDDAATATNG